MIFFGCHDPHPLESGTKLHTKHDIFVSETHLGHPNLFKNKHKSLKAMVRIKNRYLLVNILYPDPPDQNKTPSSKPSSTVPSLPAIIQFHRPTPDDLTPYLFTRALKEQIALLYGDYGVGVTSSGLNGTNLPPSFPRDFPR